jgi:hypothetical protein
MNEEELSTYQTNEKEVGSNEKTIYVRGPVCAEKQLEGYGFAEILPVFHGASGGHADSCQRQKSGVRHSFRGFCAYVYSSDEEVYKSGIRIAYGPDYSLPDGLFPRSGGLCLEFPACRWKVIWSAQMFTVRGK